MRRRRASAPAAAGAFSFGPPAASGARRSTYGHLRRESYAFAAKPYSVRDLPTVAAVHKRRALASACHSGGQIPLAPVTLRGTRPLSPPDVARPPVDRLHPNYAISSRPRLRPDSGHDRVAADESFRNRLYEHITRCWRSEQKPKGKAEERTSGQHRATLRGLGAFGQGRSPEGRAWATWHCRLARGGTVRLPGVSQCGSERVALTPRVALTWPSGTSYSKEGRIGQNTRGCWLGSGVGDADEGGIRPPSSDTAFAPPRPGRAQRRERRRSPRRCCGCRG